MLTGEPISDRLKCATIIGYAPQNIKRMLESASPDVREDHSRMRARIREHCLEKNPKAFVPKAQLDDPMNVDAIGFDRPRCTKCGKLGHDASQCWAGQGGKQGGQGKKGDGKHHGGNSKGYTWKGIGNVKGSGTSGSGSQAK